MKVRWEIGKMSSLRLEVDWLACSLRLEMVYRQVLADRQMCCNGSLYSNARPWPIYIIRCFS